MKKLFVFALVFVLLISGCGKEPEKIVPEVPDVPEISQGEISESVPEEQEESVPEEPSEPVLEEPEEIFQDEENDESDYVRSVLEDLGIDKDTKELVISGNSGTDRIELIDNFVASVEKNEAAEVCGMMYGHTMPYYFELSFEPGGMIKHTQISKALGSRRQVLGRSQVRHGLPARPRLPRDRRRLRLPRTGYAGGPEHRPPLSGVSEKQIIDATEQNLQNL